MPASRHMATIHVALHACILSTTVPKGITLRHSPLKQTWAHTCKGLTATGRLREIAVSRGILQERNQTGFKEFSLHCMLIQKKMQVSLTCVSGAFKKKSHVLAVPQQTTETDPRLLPSAGIETSLHNSPRQQLQTLQYPPFKQ